MAFTVTRGTLENNSLLFLRDVLRENLTDPLTGDDARSSASDWIVKSPLKNEDIDLPMVILDSTSVSERRITFRMAVPVSITVGIMIWAEKIQHRDELADDVKEILQDDSKTDGTNTIVSQGFQYNTSESRNNDGYIKDHSELLRIKEMDITFDVMK